MRRRERRRREEKEGGEGGSVLALYPKPILENTAYFPKLDLGELHPKTNLAKFSCGAKGQFHNEGSNDESSTMSSRNST